MATRATHLVAVVKRPAAPVLLVPRKWLRKKHGRKAISLLMKRGGWVRLG